jgi:UDP-glucose 4-epimerase
MKRILVVGGAGYIGSACTEYLLDNDYEVVVFDALLTGHEDAVDSRAVFIKGDLNDRSKIMDVVVNGNFDGIMHFAACSLVGESMTNPGKYFSNNLGAGINLLDAAVEGKVKSIVFSSTCATYGIPEVIPITEREKQDPISPYGESKLMFEKALKWYNKIFGLKYAALRYFNAAGATDNYGEDHYPETHLIPLVLKTAQGKRESISIFGDDYPTPDGTCIRDYIHILDLAQAHMLALDAPESGHYNLGSGRGMSVREIIDTAREVTGCEISVEIASRREGAPERLIGDSMFAKEKLGWNPQFDNPRDIISSAWKWMQKYPNGYSK